MKIKHYQGVLESDVKMYKDFAMKNEYFHWMGRYDVQFIGEKARVLCVSLGEKDQKSRLNKVTQVGKVTDDSGKFNLYFYEMTVNGKKVFFKSKHNIYGN